MTSPSFDDVSISSLPDKRSEAEERWVSFHSYLLSKGYQLRPRYQPDWVPSWYRTGAKPLDCEDRLDSKPLRRLDATRIQDQQQVMLKISSRQPCCPMSRIIPHPGSQLWPIRAEVHDFLQQLFKGLLFMHQNNTAHLDIASPNVMMDARSLYTEPFHPFYQTLSLDAKRILEPQYHRSQKHTRYYFIDLGYSVRLGNGATVRSVPRGRVSTRENDSKGCDSEHKGNRIP
ncbi:hypothetical protein OPQ81_000688 [Rhizoctonia solani]|nr:hypothetical protein OPQ81_000688 [Rhizoctonia solani]